MGIMYDSGWQVDSSEETAGTILFGVSSGKIYLSNGDSGESMTLGYRCVSVGAGKGPPVGASWSKKTDPSGGFDNVAMMPGRMFSDLMFPRRGYMIGVGGSAGVVGSILGMDVTGGGVTAVIFGVWPVVGGVRMWGFGNSALPGGGFTGGLASFWVE